VVEITVRDLLYAAGLAGGLTTVYSKLRERLTRVETQHETGQAETNRRLGTVEVDVQRLQDAAGQTREQLAAMTSEVRGLSARVGALEDSVHSSARAVIDEIRRHAAKNES
jgi:hypothetical protein